jgi:hypothetical protein
MVVLLAALSSACQLPFPGEEACAGVGSNAITVDVRDQNGRAAAYGSRVTFTDVDDGFTEILSETFDSLRFYGLGDKAGDGRTFDVKVERPYYASSVTRNVKTVKVRCVTSPIAVTVQTTIQLQAGAPSVRLVNIVQDRVLLDRPPYSSSVTFRTYVDANPEASQAVTWSITGDTASVFFDAVNGRVDYRCRPTSGYLTIRARSAVNPALSDTALIAVQGHPAASNDPPC